MTQQEIQERNKQIALMLADYEEDTFRFVFKKELWNNITYSLSKRHHEEQLCFHSDWNWLMEAIEFIEYKKEFIVSIKSTPTVSRNWIQHIIKIQNDKVRDIVDSSYITNYSSDYYNNESKKEAVFMAISDFAKLYNENKL